MARRSRPTITDVARLAGVSSATVSYVLSGPSKAAARISEETAERVREAVKEVGYVPNQSARSLRTKKSDRVIFLASRLSSLYSQAMASAFESALGKHGLSLDVQVGSGKEEIRRALMVLDQRLADGLIVETGDTHLPMLRTAAEAGHPLVVVGPSQPDAVLDVIVYADKPAIAEAMAHLNREPGRAFLLLSATPGNIADQRMKVAVEALGNLDVPATSIEIRSSPHDRVAAFNVAMEVLPDMPRPLAVYAGSDVSAIGVLWACRHLGLRVPEDVAILGHGDNPETEITLPALSSLGPVDHDLSSASQLLATRIADRSLAPRSVIQSWQLVTRGST